VARYPTGLIAAASGGDRDALASLLAAAQPDIRRYARRSCRSSSDAEDAVQETLFVLYRHLSGLRQAGYLSTWLFTIVQRQCLKLTRAMLGAGVDLEVAERDGRLAERPATDLRIDLAGAIQSLPEHYRAVVVLRDIQELTIDEIAAALDSTREAVKARLHRARLLIREYLGD
jgi:RNA polymerase sigma factor (sigma-70 family)